MEKGLPARAERFLRSLASELRALSSDERDAVLLELRGHLLERAVRGETALDAALAALGAPRDLAAAFDQGIGAGVAHVPPGFETSRRHLGWGEVVNEVRATLRASRNGLIMVGGLLVTVLTATNFLIWMRVLRPEVGDDALVPTMMIVRIAAALLAFCAGYRLALSDEPHPWLVRFSTFRFAAAMVAMVFTTVGGTILIERGATALLGLAAAPAGTVLAAKAIIALLALALFSAMFLRVQPWLAALAAERRDFTLGASWRGTKGRMANILRGWAVLVLPLYLIHFALNLLALKVVPFGPTTLALAGLDGIVSMGVALAAILLTATIFRWAAGEPIPAARPFGTEAPDGHLVAQAKARMETLMLPQIGRQPPCPHAL
jgi:hypothetical protein